MEVKVFVRNSSSLTTHGELTSLFAQAGEVTSVNLIMNDQRNEARGLPFSPCPRSEADKAVSRFAYPLDQHRLKLELVRHRQQRGFARSF